MSLSNFQDGYLEVGNGEEIYWSSHGNPDGEPILLIHAGYGNTFDLENLSGFSQEDYHIITWHQRGEGKSQNVDPQNTPSIFTHVLDAERLRIHLGIEDWHVFSWSFGAVFMSAYGCIYPERCRSLSAFGPFLGDMEDWDIIMKPDPEKERQYLEHYQAGDIAEAKNKAFERAVLWDKTAKIKDQFVIATFYGYEGTEEEYIASKTDEEWDSALARIHRADKLYDESMNILGRRWLFNLAHENSAFQSLPTTLWFGSEDKVVAPNSNTWFVYPYAQQIIISGADHDIHSAAVQAEIGKKFSQMPHSVPVHES